MFARAGTHVVFVVVIVIVVHRWFVLHVALRHWHFALDERRHFVDLITERNGTREVCCGGARRRSQEPDYALSRPAAEPDAVCAFPSFLYAFSGPLAKSAYTSKEFPNCLFPANY